VPHDKASLEALTMKTVFLVAVTTARRVSELSALGRNPPYARIETEGVRLRTLPGFLSKTATASHLGQDIFLPEYGNNKALCVKRLFKLYVKSSDKILRDKGEDHLFVNFGGHRKGEPSSKQTIARWIVQVIKAAYAAEGMTSPSVNAHSSRSTGTSWAMFNGASIDAVMKAADWRGQMTFAGHYSLDLWKQKDAAFGRAVLST